MGFSSLLQGRAAHEALLVRQDAELRLLDTMKRCLSQKVKCDKEYAIALTAASQQGLKIDRADDLQGSLITKAWRAIMEEWDQTAKQLKSKAELLESVCQDKLTHLYQDKRKARKTYQEEHSKIAARFTTNNMIIKIYLFSAFACTILTHVWSRQNHQRKFHHSDRDKDNDLSLWIDEQQVKMFSGFSMKIYAIDNGKVSAHIKDPNFNLYLPIIPSEVSLVNFTWKSGSKKYYYNFDRLQSLDESILKPPTLSIKIKGRIPQEPKGPDPECDKKCANKGWCKVDKMCQCKEGYMGQFCETALCYPQCMLNGGNCTAPAVCSCPPGYQGRHCEGGICAEKCLNGGKCIQKDKCHCPKGYYGLRCEFSKCVIPCMNNGKCIGNNKCRCEPGLGGNHCEIGRHQRSTCKKPCRHGQCLANHTCRCHEGWYGRYCNQRDKHKRSKSKF